ncbi:Vps54-like protein-domain-containing protein [Hyaloraphidium curvatum]|nr:Vps54-like protein-domain-containing protein [Hyaloraphidium curvatum]
MSNPFEAAVSSERAWTFADIGRNAVSSVTAGNAPDRRPPPPADAAPAPIRRVRNADFEPYIALVGDAYGRYEFNRAAGLEGAPALGGPASSGSLGSLPELAALAPAPPRRDAYALQRARNAAAGPGGPALSTVPPVFFQPGFSLENPHTFAVVCEGGAAGALPAGKAPDPLVYASSVLQEKLSHYLDTVEIHLVKEISRRSSSFFAALSNLQSLHADTLECVSEISAVRARLARLAQSTSKQGLRVVKLKRRRANLAELLRSLTLIGELRQTQPMVQLLLGQNDYVGALDLIGDAFATIQTARAATTPRADQSQPQQAADLDYRAVKAIAHTYGQLSEVYRTIGLVMEAEFVGVLASFVKDPAELAAAPEIAARLAADPPPDAAALAAEGGGVGPLADRVSPTLRGLVHTRKVVAAMRTFKETARKDLKAATKEYYRLVAGTADRPPAPGKSALATQLRTMTFDAFFSLLTRVYASHLVFLRRTALALRTIARPNGAVAKPSGGGAGAEQTQAVARTVSDLQAQASKEASSILAALADLSHTRCAKLLSVRSEHNAQLNAKDFRRLYTATWTFVAATEAVCGKPTLGLKGAIVNQSRSFLRNFHEEKIKQLALLIESEPWTQAAVPLEFQAIADALSGSPTQAVSSLPKESAVRMSEDDAGAALGADSGNSTKFLVVGGQRFYAVGCVLIFVKMLADYLQCLDDVPIAVTEVIHDLLEILTLFNSRICQVILGAGAVASLGLKNITAKHLALASQSLAIVIALIPAIRKNLQSKLNGRQAMVLLNDFDRKLGDYTEHQKQIYAKLVSIMSDRLAIHIKAMHATTWAQPAPEGKPNAYMLGLVKDLVTLHRVLSKYLSEDILRQIVTQVADIYNQRLEEEIQNVPVTSSAGKDRLLADVQFYVTELGGVYDIAPASNRLTIAVNNKTVQSLGNRSASPMSMPRRSQSPT